MKKLKNTFDEFLYLINEHIKNTNTNKEYNVRPRLKFEVNGKEFSLSVQASNAAYCTPRKDNQDFYEEVELGFPDFLFSQEFIDKYAECDQEPKETIYAYVPVEALAKELSKLVEVYDEQIKKL